MESVTSDNRKAAMWRPKIYAGLDRFQKVSGEGASVVNGYRNAFALISCMNVRRMVLFIIAIKK